VYDNYVPVKDWVDAAYSVRRPAVSYGPANAAGKVYDTRGRYLGTYSKAALKKSQTFRNGVCLIEVPGEKRVTRIVK
jgi:hypothetical protein